MYDANKEINRIDFFYFLFILSYNQFRNLMLFKEEVKLSITLSKKAIKS